MAIPERSSPPEESDEVVPTTLIVSADTFERIVKMIENPPAPTPALLRLMAGDSFDDEP